MPRSTTVAASAPDLTRKAVAEAVGAAAPGFAGLAIGLVLGVVHLVGLPLDGTSVNPARSIGPALLNGGEPLAHVWMVIVAPLVGGALAALAAPFFETRAAEFEVDPTGVDVPA
jgi:aquaporin Z